MMRDLTKAALGAAALVMLGTGAMAAEATPQERAHCEALLKNETKAAPHSHAEMKGMGSTAPTTQEHQMGTTTQHSHAEMKGTLAQTPMNREHERCRQIMAESKKSKK